MVMAQKYCIEMNSTFNSVHAIQNTKKKEKYIINIFYSRILNQSLDMKVPYSTVTILI